MTWHLTQLGVHLAALVALAMLWRAAPDVLQRVALALLMVSMAIAAWGFASAIGGFDISWMVRRLASELEHLGVLVYVFRLFVVDQERRCLNSYRHSPSSPR